MKDPGRGRAAVVSLELQLSESEQDVIGVRCRSAVVVTAMALLVASCGSAAAMSDDEVARCASVSEQMGSLGGSNDLISLLVRRLPDDAIGPSGTPPDEVEANFDRAFHEMYGIHVDEFLALRGAADEATTERLGEAPSSGELVSDAWFNERDVALLEAWNEQYPSSARAYCRMIVPPK